MVAQNLMQLLVRFNNIGTDSQVCNATSRPSNVKYMETHTQKDKWGRVTKGEPNVESTKMLLLHNARETLARLHNRRIQELVHNLLSKNVTTSIPSMLYARCFYDMIQDDRI